MADDDGPVSGRIRRVRKKFEGLKESPHAAVEDAEVEGDDDRGRLARVRDEVRRSLDEGRELRDEVAASLPDPPEDPAPPNEGRDVIATEDRLSDTEQAVAAVAVGEVSEAEAADAYGVAPETMGLAVDDLLADGDLEPATEQALVGGGEEYDVPFAFGPPDESMLFGPNGGQPDEQFDHIFDDRRWF
jgi:hypothetical protein